MKLFILLMMQVFVLMPLASFAADGGTNPFSQNQKKTEVTEARKALVINSYGKLPLYFIENKGQVDAQVRFYERGARHATFFTKDGVVLSLTKSEGKYEKSAKPAGLEVMKDNKDRKFTAEAVTLSFVGGNEKARITAGEKMPGHVNYFTGNDKKKWRSNIPTYGAVTYNDVYNHIDIKFYGNNKNIEHDVIVHPGGDPSMVKFAYKGVKGLQVTESGDLEVTLNGGKILEKRPFIYQEIKGQRVAVEGSYRLINGEDKAFTYGFDVASYDKTKNLVIDPVLDYSTYLGGSGDDYSSSIVVDSSGAAYVTGYTLSADFPLVNPVQAAYGGGFDDVFITKIHPTGTAIVYSTYLGGNGNDTGYGIAVDNTGAAYVTGYTLSADFPLVNPIQGALVRSSDAFATKINPTGAAIIYSTYLGGDESDFGSSIAVDSSGAAYVTGYTNSYFFPLVNPIKRNLGGRMDAFITKIAPDGSSYVYSTYLGGQTLDYGRSIDVDGNGAAYVTGSTNSPDFPLMNPIQAVFGGGSEDAFVTKINAAGSAITYSTYLGGNSNDSGYGLALDSTGAAYITGLTLSTDFPLVNQVQATFGGGIDTFVTKINLAGTAYVYSTYLGGQATDKGLSIAVDNTGAAYVTGYTDSPDFPFIAPVQERFGGGFWDTFISKIDSMGKAIVYSTYLGGSGDDMGHGIDVDGTGAAYVTGRTDSPDFPLQAPIQGATVGGIDAFITKVSNTPSPAVYLSSSPDAVAVARGSVLGYTVTASNTTAVEQCFQYWEDVTLPNGTTYPPTGALFGPVRLCLNAGASKAAHLTQDVSMAAPVGAYVFNAYLGAYPIAVVDEAHFNLEVTAFNPANATPETSWRLLENGFRK